MQMFLIENRSHKLIPSFSLTFANTKSRLDTYLDIFEYIHIYVRLSECRKVKLKSETSGFGLASCSEKSAGEEDFSRWNFGYFVISQNFVTSKKGKILLNISSVNTQAVMDAA